MDRRSLTRVGVVIVTHASAADVGAALGALPTDELARVVVVDNASPDDTVAVVRALDCANVELVEQANVGFGAGNDAGRSRLPRSAEFVLFLNPDCVIEADDIARLVDFLEDHPRCAIVGPRLRDSDGTGRTSGGALPSPTTEIQPLFPRAIGRFIPRRQLPADVAVSQPVGYVEGACMLIRLEPFDAVGGFDHRYFLCFEEMDLAHRIADAGWTVDLCAEAWATHAGQQSRQKTPAFSLFHKHLSQRIYLEHWYGERAAKRYARAASVAWWLQYRAGRLEKWEYRALTAGVTAADCPTEVRKG